MSYYYTSSYDIEFNDSISDLQGWKNSRYEGSKLVGRVINQFTPATPSGSEIPKKGEYLQQTLQQSKPLKYWGGDISYGINPVIETDVCALYIGSTIITGDEDPKLVNFTKHSYCVIDKILLIDVDTDEVQIINRLNTEQKAFKRYIQSDFPEGAACRFQLTDFFHDNNLRSQHRVKFNEGLLMKVYSYTPNTDGHEDGVFGGFGVRSDKGTPMENLASSSEGPSSYINATAPINASTKTSDGRGLFGFGTTAAASASLFNTNSIQFVNPFPDELASYADDVEFEKLGTSLNPITASYQIIIGAPPTYEGEQGLIQQG